MVEHRFYLQLPVEEVVVQHMFQDLGDACRLKLSENERQNEHGRQKEILITIKRRK